MRVILTILIMLVLYERLSAAEKNRGAMSQVATKEDIKMLREDIKILVEMMNKRFEDMQRYIDKRFEDVNRRFEDMRSYMQTIFVVLGVLNGLIIIILAVIGWRVTQRIRQEQLLIVKDMLKKPEIWEEIFQNPQVVEKISQRIKARIS